MRYDIVCVGGGFSGLVSACRAAELGAKALVLEARAEERYPCSSRFTTGVVNVMGVGVMSPPDELYAAIMSGSAPKADPLVARVVADNGARVVEWLSSKGARFINRALQKDQPGQRVLAPPRRLQAGLDWEGRGGDTLMRQLEEFLRGRGGDLWRGAKAVSLAMEGGACVGVEVARGGGTERVEAGAVVIADGGFAANKEMIAKHITPRADRVFSRVGPGAMGDGVRMAEAAGAKIGGFGEFYGHVHHAAAMTNEKQWPYPHLDSIAELCVVVGPDGARFVDEGRGGVCMANAIAGLPDPLSAHLVMDDDAWANEPKYSLTVACNPAMTNNGGPLTTAATLDALAKAIGAPAAALADTVAKHNACVAKGDFSGLAVARTSRKHAPLPIAKAPFHAVPLAAGITGTMGGVVITANAQAVDANGAPIKGLYAVGTPVAGLEGGPRAGYVGGLSKSFVLGLVAGEHIAANK